MRARPTAAVLVFERDHVAVCIHARIAAGVGEQEEREKAEHLGLTGHEVVRATRARRMASSLTGLRRSSSPEVAE